MPILHNLTLKNPFYLSLVNSNSFLYKNTKKDHIVIIEFFYTLNLVDFLSV